MDKVGLEIYQELYHAGLTEHFYRDNCSYCAWNLGGEDETLGSCTLN